MTLAARHGRGLGHDELHRYVAGLLGAQHAARLVGDETDGGDEGRQRAACRKRDLQRGRRGRGHPEDVAPAAGDTRQGVAEVEREAALLVE